MTVDKDGEFWSIRIAMLSALAHADALAVVLRPRDDELVTYAAHNVAPTGAWSGTAQASLLASALGGGPGEGPVLLPLLDGRTAVAMRAQPIHWQDHRIGALAALRVGGPFGDEES